MKEGFRVAVDKIYKHHNCYTDSSNNVVINYNGDVYKCTARDFTKERREGILLIDGTIEFNEIFTKRMSMKYSNTACRNCSILPICNGGCTQNKLENPQKEHCYQVMSEDEKIKKIQERMKMIINNTKGAQKFAED